MGVDSVLPLLDSAIEDADEETFLLFSQNLPDARDLGFVDAKATTVSVQLGNEGDEISVTQSPTLLGSSLSTGTTGAVLWRVSPLVAGWLRQAGNPLFAHSILNSHSTVLELGCGITGIMAMAVAPRVGRYICTDQQYVMKVLRQNLDEHLGSQSSSSAFSGKSSGKKSTKRAAKAASATRQNDNAIASNVLTLALDWEASLISSLATEVDGLHSNLDLVLACDCIYNSHLVGPLVQTCFELCKLRATNLDQPAPIPCLVAQQLRSEDVFCEWLNAFMLEFKVWRIPETMLPDSLWPEKGFALHIGILHS